MGAHVSYPSNQLILSIVADHFFADPGYHISQTDFLKLHPISFSVLDLTKSLKSCLSGIQAITSLLLSQGKIIGDIGVKIRTRQKCWHNQNDDDNDKDDDDHNGNEDSYDNDGDDGDDDDDDDDDGDDDDDDDDGDDAYDDYVFLVILLLRPLIMGIVFIYVLFCFSFFLFWSTGDYIMLFYWAASCITYSQEAIAIYYVTPKLILNISPDISHMLITPISVLKLFNRSNLKRRNTLGCLDQYTRIGLRLFNGRDRETV